MLNMHTVGMSHHFFEGVAIIGLMADNITVIDIMNADIMNANPMCKKWYYEC